MTQPQQKTTEVMNCSRCRIQLTNEEDRVTVFGSTFHLKCLTCDECNASLIKGFHHNYGRFYCGKCVLALVPNCANCNKAIGLDASVKAGDLEYHVDCCVCDFCKKPFEGGHYFPYGGRPYCLQDYWNRVVEKEQQQQRANESDMMTAEAIELTNKLKKSKKRQKSKLKINKE